MQLNDTLSKQIRCYYYYYKSYIRSILIMSVELIVEKLLKNLIF